MSGVQIMLISGTHRMHIDSFYNQPCLYIIIPTQKLKRNFKCSNLKSNDANLFTFRLHTEEDCRNSSRDFDCPSRAKPNDKGPNNSQRGLFLINTIINFGHHVSKNDI